MQKRKVKKLKVNSELSEKKLVRDDLEFFLKIWNTKFPYDKLWRDKYKIPFRSKAHLEVSQIDIYLDIREDILINRLRVQRLKSLKDKEEYLKEGTLLKEKVLTQEEEDKIYDNLKFPTTDG